MQQLFEMKQQYGDRIRVQCRVDEEHGRPSPSDMLQKVLKHTISSNPSTSTARAAAFPDPESIRQIQQCMYHSSRLLAVLDTDPPTPSTAGKRCPCGSPGKDLLMVSGPDGFVEALAGPKRWHEGKELQGPVGGAIAKLMAKKPDLLKDYLVLKL